MTFANNLTRFLNAHKVAYQVLLYEYSPETHSALAVADAVDRPHHMVYKSLIAVPVKSTTKPAVVMIPGEASLDLKKLAKALGEKKMQMASRDEAEKLTGMQAGGISPLALVNRGFRICLDERAKELDQIVISAGQRGAQVELAVSDLQRITGASWVAL